MMSLEDHIVEMMLTKKARKKLLKESNILLVVAQLDYHPKNRKM